MSSKWNRPMRRFQSVQLVCRECEQPIRMGRLGGWDHVRRIGITDPKWHLAQP